MRKVEREALKLVNKLRKANKLERLEQLPYGTPLAACSCPIAIALKPCGIRFVLHETADCPTRRCLQLVEKVWGKRYALGGAILLPKAIKAYVKWFDDHSK